MQTPQNDPKITAMPILILMKDYDAWETLISIFGNYDLNKLRKELWDMYKSAMVDQDTYRKKKHRRCLNELYDTVNDLATAAYIIYEQEGYHRYFEVDARAAFFPKWQRFQRDPYEVLNKIYTDYTLDEMRSQLWAMYKSAFLNRKVYHGRRDRHDLREFFERLINLTTTTYVIAKENMEQRQREKVQNT